MLRAWVVGQMTGMIALAVVALTGLYFVSLAVASLTVPLRVASFLRSLGSSPRAHYLELLTRLLVGGAMLLYAAQSRYAAGFSLFGWVLVITSAGMLVVPWRWHQRFAKQSVPYAIRYLNLVAVASFVIGGLILALLVRDGLPL